MIYLYTYVHTHGVQYFDIVYFTDDEDQLREELKDLIDDNPIEESEGEDSDGSNHHKKRKKSDDEDFDDRLEDEDYDLIEENLGVKLERVCFYILDYSLNKENVYENDMKYFILCYRSVLNVFEESKMKNQRKNKKRKQMKKGTPLRMNCSKVPET